MNKMNTEITSESKRNEICKGCLERDDCDIWNGIDMMAKKLLTTCPFKPIIYEEKYMRIEYYEDIKGIF